MSAVNRIRQFKEKFPPTFEKYFGIGWPGWIRAPIWMATFVALTALMVRELSSNLDDYNFNNIVPEMNVVVGESNPPNLTVCAPYYSKVLFIVADWVMNERNRKHNWSIPSTPCYECEGMANNSWDVWQDEAMFSQAKYTDQYAGALVIALVKKVVESIETAKTILLTGTNAHWNQAIVDALWLFVSCKAMDDYSMLRHYGNPRDWYSCWGMNLSSLDYISHESIDHLYDLLFDCMELYLQIYISDQVGLDPDGTFYPDHRVPIKFIEVFTPLANAMCFRLPPRSTYVRLNYFPFPEEATPESTKRYKYLPWKRPNERSNIDGVFYVYEDTMLYEPGISKLTLFRSNNATLGRIWSIYARLTYNLQTYMDVRGQHSTCSEDNIPMSCKAKIQFKGAIEHCGCVPFLHRYLRRNDTKLPYCNVSFEGCEHINRTFSEFSEYSNCTRRCEYADYKFWIDHVEELRPDNFDSDLTTFLLELTPANGSTLKIDFTHKTTFGQFMSQIGGTLNLYLGLSGLTICAFLFFLIDRAKRCRQRGTNSDHSSGRHAPMFRFHILWFALRALQVTAKQDGGDKNGKTDDDTITTILNRLDALEGKSRKPDGSAIATIMNRLDALEGKNGKPDDGVITTIMKKFEIVADRLDALEGKCGKQTWTRL